LILRGWEPGGRGVTLNFFQPVPARLNGARRAHLARIASHLGAAYRLRRRLGPRAPGEAEAILDATGELHHAGGPPHGKSRRARTCASRSPRWSARAARFAPTIPSSRSRAGGRSWRAAGAWSTSSRRARASTSSPT